MVQFLLESGWILSWHGNKSAVLAVKVTEPVKTEESQEFSWNQESFHSNFKKQHFFKECVGDEPSSVTSPQTDPDTRIHSIKIN